MLRGGSGCTIIVSRRSSIRRSIPEYFTPGAVAPASDAFVIVSALVPYKRLELAIDSRSRRAAASRHHRRRTRTRATSRRWRRAAPGVRLLGRLDDDARARPLPHGARRCCCRARRTSASCRWRPRRADARSWRWAAAGATETVIDGVTGLLVPDDTVAAWAAALRARPPTTWAGRPHPRQRRTLRPRRGSAREFNAARRRGAGRARRSSDGKALQPAARRPARPHRRLDRRRRVRARLPHPLRARRSSTSPRASRPSRSTSTCCRSSR